ncbi:hypothetical protein [Sphingomonas sp. Ant H11]|uniref:hypothetical protein n=1 Tax=Sphingomonas sp. Ant H11 TaxID=1564113 RepID=UPI001E54B0DF|nr:hypothetical protein [Sphingomonas sp. Ant H11]
MILGFIPGRRRGVAGRLGLLIDDRAQGGVCRHACQHQRAQADEAELAQPPSL